MYFTPFANCVDVFLQYAYCARFAYCDQIFRGEEKMALFSNRGFCYAVCILRDFVNCVEHMASNIYYRPILTPVLKILNFSIIWHNLLLWGIIYQKKCERKYHTRLKSYVEHFFHLKSGWAALYICVATIYIFSTCWSWRNDPLVFSLPPPWS